MACEYCDGINKHNNHYISVLPDVVIKKGDGDMRLLSVMSSENSDNAEIYVEVIVPINYCPMCGRDLRGDDQ